MLSMNERCQDCNKPIKQEEICVTAEGEKKKCAEVTFRESAEGVWCERCTEPDPDQDE